MGGVRVRPGSHYARARHCHAKIDACDRFSDSGRSRHAQNAIKAASGNNLEAVEIEEIKSNPPTDKVEVHTEIEAHDKAKFEDAEKLLKVQVDQPHFLMCVDACDIVRFLSGRLSAWALRLVQANVDNALVAVSLPKSTAYQFVEGDHDHSSATCMKPTPVAVLAAATAIFASALCV